jgi:DNA-binding transcriptional regulator YdaS (Cro superfamily)
MDLARQLYATRGAVTAVARALGISDAAVSQWKLRGIPARRWEAVSAAFNAHVAALGADAARRLHTTRPDIPQPSATEAGIVPSAEQPATHKSVTP